MEPRQRTVVIVSVFLIALSAVFLHAQTSGETQLYDIEAMVRAAVENSETVRSARENLRRQVLNREMLPPILGSSVSVHANVSGALGSSPATGVSFGVSDSENISVSVPLLTQLSLSASAGTEIGSLAIGSLSVSLDYKPFAENTQTEQADKSVTLAEVGLQEALIAAELDARKKYISLVSAVKAAALAEQALQLANRNFDTVSSRYEAGLASKDELLSGERDHRNSQLQELRARKTEYASRSTMSKIAGIDCSQANFSELPDYELEPFEKDTMVAKALANSLSLRRSQMQLTTDREALSKARRSLPNLGLGLQIGSNLKSQDYFTFGLSVNLSWSFLRSVDKEVELAQMVVDQAERSLEAAQRDLRDAIEAALLDLEISTISLELLRIAEEQAQTAYQSVQKDFEQGSVNYLQVEDARLSAVEATQSYIDGQRQAWSAWYSLLALVAGKG